MRKNARGFAGDERGNIALLFGLLILPLTICTGVALDMMRGNQVRSELAEAADAAVLSAARAKLTNPDLTDAAAKEIAKKLFYANRLDKTELEIDSFEFIHDTVNNVFRVTAVGRMKTSLLGLAGIEWMPINVLSEAKAGSPRVLEVVLVLDNTDSMDGTKMDDLKDAADILVDQVMADTDNNAKVGIVPFSYYVNVGLSRRHEWWIDVQDDYQEMDCYDTYPDAVSSNCRTETGTCTDDGFEYSCSYEVCDWDYGDPVEVCGMEDIVWNGCVGSRDYPLNIKDEDFAIHRVPGVLDKWCPQEITPMTTNKSEVMTKIQSLWTTGETYIPTGLTWGIRLISNEAPFSEGISYADAESQFGVKAIVLMTDGKNTRSPTYPKHSGWDSDESDGLMIELCDEAKAKNIQIYTVAFEVTDQNIKDLLTECASSAGNFHDAGDGAALTDAFASIATNLQELALTK